MTVYLSSEPSFEPEKVLAGKISCHQLLQVGFPGRYFQYDLFQRSESK
jgi:hypothetical protein